MADAEKAKKGTLQKCRTAKPSQILPGINISAPPTPPEWLGDYGRQEWIDKVDMLDRMKMLHKTDMGLLAMLCKEWQNYVEAETSLDKHSRYYSVKGEGESVKYWGIHPGHTISQQHLKAYITLCNEFGFSPASRSRISMPTDEKIVSKAALLLKKAV